jgi:hypothetical protein
MTIIYFSEYQQEELKAELHFGVPLESIEWLSDQQIRLNFRYGEKVHSRDIPYDPPPEIPRQSSTAYKGPVIGNKRECKYHHPETQCADKIAHHNQANFSSPEEAAAVGYIPCQGTCKHKFRAGK